MYIKMRWIVLLSVMIFRVYISDAQSAQLDFSGVKKFWEVMEVLQDDREPDSLLWNRLFETPGYAAIEKREKKRTVFIKAFRYAYMPSLKKHLESALEKQDYLAGLLKHLVQVPAKKHELELYQMELMQSFSLVKPLQKLQRLIPDTLLKQYAPPPVSFIIFAADGRGYPNRIVSDILHIKGKLSADDFYAHELFHFYYSKLPGKIGEVDSSEQMLIDRLLYIAEEGIADMNDKIEYPFFSQQKIDTLFPESNGRYFRDYINTYNESSKWIEYMNTVFTAMAQDHEHAGDIGAKFNTGFHLEGRPTGAFMAKTIIDAFGYDTIKQSLHNPFSFFFIYSKAAEKTGKKPLSNIAISQLELFERKYR